LTVGVKARREEQETEEAEGQVATVPAL